ncbi:plant intracellular RAS-group-related lrr protein 6 [Phtheirospermum japonicum]|uniref:Plant intracellular RAS-group-related lrr protein 6 n=1 Tax=Phtheirospermum japonicum TaxID=374723 RepID=A0A830CUE6_9LAMI|nr:plant intracellular RAS-group-related lrr protein 6 [Phtheirospermum japonicum]
MMVNYQGDDCMTMESFTGLRNLNHRLTDDELFWRASFVPQKEEMPFRRVPRVAFMFLTRGPLPMLPLWERFFSRQDVDKYSIYVHVLPGFELKVDNASVFYKRQHFQLARGAIKLFKISKAGSRGNKLEMMSNNFIASCSRLIELNASKNLLRSLPESIGSLTRLIMLDLHQNSK